MKRGDVKSLFCAPTLCKMVLKTVKTLASVHGNSNSCTDAIVSCYLSDRMGEETNVKPPEADCIPRDDSSVLSDIPHKRTFRENYQKLLITTGILQTESSEVINHDVAEGLDDFAWVGGGEADDCGSCCEAGVDAVEGIFEDVCF